MTKCSLITLFTFTFVCTVDRILSCTNLTMIVVGGQPSNGKIVFSSVEIFDPVARNWSTGQYFYETTAFLSAVYVDGLTYLVLNDTPPNIALYNPVSGTWLPVGSTTITRSNYSSAVILDKIYTVGGTATANSGVGSVVVSTAEMYDVSTSQSLSIASMIQPRALFCLEPINGILYAAGGYNQSNISINKVEAYNVTTGNWIQVAPMLSSRYGHCSATFGGKMYVSEGQNSAGTYLSSCEAYNPVSNSWQLIASMSVGKYLCSAIAYQGLIYVIGGLNQLGYAINLVEVYDPAVNSWQQLSAGLNTPRAAFGLALVQCPTSNAYATTTSLPPYWSDLVSAVAELCQPYSNFNDTSDPFALQVAQCIQVNFCDAYTLRYQYPSNPTSDAGYTMWYEKTVLIPTQLYYTAFYTCASNYIANQNYSVQSSVVTTSCSYYFSWTIYLIADFILDAPFATVSTSSIAIQQSVMSLLQICFLPFNIAFTLIALRTLREVCATHEMPARIIFKAQIVCSLIGVISYIERYTETFWFISFPFCFISPWYAVHFSTNLNAQRSLPVAHYPFLLFEMCLKLFICIDRMVCLYKPSYYNFKLSKHFYNRSFFIFTTVYAISMLLLCLIYFFFITTLGATVVNNVTGIIVAVTMVFCGLFAIAILSIALCLILKLRKSTVHAAPVLTLDHSTRQKRDRDLCYYVLGTAVVDFLAIVLFFFSLLYDLKVSGARWPISLPQWFSTSGPLRYVAAAMINISLPLCFFSQCLFCRPFRVAARKLYVQPLLSFVYRIAHYIFPNFVPAYNPEQQKEITEFRAAASSVAARGRNSRL